MIFALRVSTPRKGAHRTMAPRTASPTLPRTRRPEGMSLEDWQIALRREFGREQKFPPGEPRHGAGLLRVRRHQPATQRTYRVAIRGRNPGDNYLLLPRLRRQHAGHLQAHRVHAGRLGAQARRQGGLRAPAFTPPIRRSTCATALSARWSSAPEPTARQPLRRLASPLFRRRTAPEAGGVRPIPRVPGRRQRRRPRAALLRRRPGVHRPGRATAQRRRRDRQAFPQGAAQPAFADLLKASLYPYQRQGALFAAEGRPLPARRRHGPGQDDPGHRRRRDPGADRRRRARADRLPHLAQAPVEAGDRASSPAAIRRGRRGLSSGARGRCTRPTTFFKITNYDVIHRDLDVIRRWQPDLIILDEAQRIKNWKTRTARTVKRLDSALRLRAHRHAAGEPAGGTALDRRVRRPLPPGADVPLPRRAPARGRARAGSSATATSREIAETLAPILLRRTKDEVLQGAARAAGQSGSSCR